MDVDGVAHAHMMQRLRFALAWVDSNLRLVFHTLLLCSAHTCGVFHESVHAEFQYWQRCGRSVCVYIVTAAFCFGLG